MERVMLGFSRCPATCRALLLGHAPMRRLYLYLRQLIALGLDQRIHLQAQSQQGRWWGPSAGEEEEASGEERRGRGGGMHADCPSRYCTWRPATAEALLC